MESLEVEYDLQPRPTARRLEAGIALLVQARRYADELASDVWDFAVEIDALRAAGLSNSDLRWLASKGYVAHAHEIFPPGRNARAFRKVGGLVFTKRSCFVLTDGGVHLQGGNGQDHRAPFAPERLPLSGGNGVARLPAHLTPRAPTQPCWDADNKELHVGGVVVKRFNLPSPNQQMILTAFEEDGWPPRIDDPLPPASRIDPKRRLRDTIKSLNRKQKQRLIRFMGDGTGQGVRWCLTVT